MHSVKSKSLQGIHICDILSDLTTEHVIRFPCTKSSKAVSLKESAVSLQTHYVLCTLRPSYQSQVSGGGRVCVCVTAVYCGLIPIVQHVSACSCQSPLGPSKVSSFPVKPDADEWEVWHIRSGFREAGGVCCARFGYCSYSDCGSARSAQETLPTERWHWEELHILSLYSTFVAQWYRLALD